MICYQQIITVKTVKHNNVSTSETVYKILKLKYTKTHVLTNVTFVEALPLTS